MRSKEMPGGAWYGDPTEAASRAARMAAASAALVAVATAF